MYIDSKYVVALSSTAVTSLMAADEHSLSSWLQCKCRAQGEFAA